MYPFIQNDVQALHADDINGIQNLYGSPISNKPGIYLSWPTIAVNRINIDFLPVSYYYFFAYYHIGPDNHCCGEVVMKSDGKTKEKHLSRLGKFVKSGGATDNRYSYRQQNGDSYLYWQNGVWMVK